MCTDRYIGLIRLKKLFDWTGECDSGILKLVPNVLNKIISSNFKVLVNHISTFEWKYFEWFSKCFENIYLNGNIAISWFRQNKYLILNLFWIYIWIYLKRRKKIRNRFSSVTRITKSYCIGRI